MNFRYVATVTLPPRYRARTYTELTYLVAADTEDEAHRLVREAAPWLFPADGRQPIVRLRLYGEADGRVAKLSERHRARGGAK